MEVWNMVRIYYTYQDTDIKTGEPIVVESNRDVEASMSEVEFMLRDLDAPVDCFQFLEVVGVRPFEDNNSFVNLSGLPVTTFQDFERLAPKGFTLYALKGFTLPGLACLWHAFGVDSMTFSQHPEPDLIVVETMDDIIQEIDFLTMHFNDWYIDDLFNETIDENVTTFDDDIRCFSVVGYRR
jgi:hypothetical protein